MKIAVLFSTFLSVPMLAFAASQRHGHYSFTRLVGGFAGNFVLFLLGAVLLRFAAKRILTSIYSRQYPPLKELSQKLIRHHNQIALSVLVLLVIHGTAMYFSRNTWSTPMLLGAISLILFMATSYFGFLMNKRRAQRKLFYTLHMITLIAAAFIGVIHIQYRLFKHLFL